MTTQNLAIVISPNLYDPTTIKNPMRAMTISGKVTIFMRLCICWRLENDNFM